MYCIPHHEKTHVFICENIGADQLCGNGEADQCLFFFAAGIVQFLNFLCPKFASSSHLLWLHSLICVRPGQKPHCWFSHDVTFIPSRLRHWYVTDDGQEVTEKDKAMVTIDGSYTELMGENRSLGC